MLRTSQNCGLKYKIRTKAIYLAFLEHQIQILAKKIVIRVDIIILELSKHQNFVYSLTISWLILKQQKSLVSNV